MDCPTVRIKATTGSYPFTTINESDFDPAKHERYVEGAPINGTRGTRPDAAELGEQVDGQGLRPVTEHVAMSKRVRK